MHTLWNLKKKNEKKKKKKEIDKPSLVLYLSELPLCIWKSNAASSFMCKFQKEGEIMENT